MTIYCVINQKGGVGKTTTAFALGAGLQHFGKKVLFIDLDPQGNLTYSMDEKPTVNNSLQAMMSGTELQPVPTKWGHLVPAGPSMATATMLLTDKGKIKPKAEFLLRKSLAGIKDRYDDIVIDTSPALGVLTVNALVASDRVVIPAQADIFSLQGIGSLFETIETIRRDRNPSLRVSGVLLTRYSPRANIRKQVEDMIRSTTGNRYGVNTFRTAIRECVAIQEAQALRTDIYTHAPKSNACEDYTSLIEEIKGDE